MNRLVNVAIWLSIACRGNKVATDDSALPTMTLDPCSEEGSDEYPWDGEGYHPGDVDYNIGIIWFDQGVQLNFDGSFPEVRFGLVATAGANALAWTGEDCVTGAIASDGKPIDACHVIPHGDSSTSLYGGADPDTIDPATQTVFTRDDRHDLTYFLGYEGRDGPDCLVAGDYWCYYESLGCGVLQGIVSDY